MLSRPIIIQLSLPLHPHTLPLPTPNTPRNTHIPRVLSRANYPWRSLDIIFRHVFFQNRPDHPPLQQLLHPTPPPPHPPPKTPPPTITHHMKAPVPPDRVTKSQRHTSHPSTSAEHQPTIFSDLKKEDPPTLSRYTTPCNPLQQHSDIRRHTSPTRATTNPHLPTNKYQPLVIHNTPTSHHQTRILLKPLLTHPFRPTHPPTHKHSSTLPLPPHTHIPPPQPNSFHQPPTHRVLSTTLTPRLLPSLFATPTTTNNSKSPGIPSSTPPNYILCRGTSLAALRRSYLLPSPLQSRPPYHHLAHP